MSCHIKCKWLGEEYDFPFMETWISLLGYIFGWRIWKVNFHELFRFIITKEKEDQRKDVVMTT